MSSIVFAQVSSHLLEGSLREGRGQERFMCLRWLFLLTNTTLSDQVTNVFADSWPPHAWGGSLTTLSDAKVSLMNVTQDFFLQSGWDNDAITF